MVPTIVVLLFLFYFVKKIVHIWIHKEDEKPNQQPETTDHFQNLTPELTVQILSHLDLVDLVNVSQTCKKLRDISEYDVVWSKHYQSVVGSNCCAETRWRYQLDLKDIINGKKLCFRSKGNIKNCFLKDNKLHKKLRDEHKKKEEFLWLVKVKWIHDLPQEAITVICGLSFMLFVVFKIDEWVDLPWIVVFTPLWLGFILFGASILTACATKIKFPHLLYRLDRGFFYRKVFKDTCCLEKSGTHDSPSILNSWVTPFLTRKFLIRMWYSALFLALCIFICTNLSCPESVFPWCLALSPLIIGIITYVLELLSCECAPEGSKLGLSIACLWIPLLSCVATHTDDLSPSADASSAVALCLAVSIATVTSIWTFIANKKSCWNTFVFRENLLSSWCFGSCLAGAFMCGVFVCLKLDALVDWSFYRVLTPMWFVDIFLACFSVFILCTPQQIYRLSKEERNSCLLGNMFLLLPCLLFEIWLCKKIDEHSAVSFFRFVLYESVLITAMVPVAHRLHLFTIARGS